jgi:phage terminase large subunit
LIDRDLLIEIARRAELRSQRPDVLEGTFPQQRAFVTSENKYDAVFCTRRSAKSFSGGTKLVYRALKYPGTNHLFTGLTRGSAKGIIWKDVLRVLDRKFGLNASFNQTDLTMTLPNGSEIWATGIDADEDEMKKVLGRKFKTAIIDEASMYTINLHDFIYGVLAPAMTDDGGVINMLGTASNFPRGLFFDITQGNEGGWGLHQWTAHDNPYVAKQWQIALDEIAKNRPLYMQTPQFKQWFLNQWVIDEEKLVYRFDLAKNLTKDVPRLPHDGWAYVLGVDLGWEDDNAFVLTAYHVNDPTLYVVDSFAAKKMTFDAVATKIQEYMRHPVMAPHKVVIDGANKQGVESMKQRSSIPFEYAEKQDKATFIELCNSDLIEAKIKFIDTPTNRPTWDEMQTLVWEPDSKDSSKIKFPKKEHPALPNHRCDAFLYAWRMGFHYHWGPTEKNPVMYSKEWFEKQADDIWEREREHLREIDQGGGWPSDF